MNPKQSKNKRKSLLLILLIVVNLLLMSCTVESSSSSSQNLIANTLPPTRTVIPVATFGSTLTPTASPPPTNTITLTISRTNTMTPTVTMTATIVTETYYVVANGAVNIRACGSTDCNIVDSANPGDALRVIDDSGDWYELQLENGKIGYIANFLVGKTISNADPVQSTGIPESNDSQSIVSTAIPQSNNSQPIVPTPIPPSNDSAVCGGVTTCGAMTSCEQAYACLHAGNGRLDRDNDGIPCESICGG